MEGYDAIVSPTLSTVTFPVGVPFDKAYPKYPGGPSLISPGNLAGLPALALPNGFGPNGLPTSSRSSAAPGVKRRSPHWAPATSAKPPSTASARRCVTHAARGLARLARQRPIADGGRATPSR